MGKILPFFGIIGIVIIMYFVLSAGDGLEDQVRADYTEAQELVKKFGNSGEEIVFYLDPQPPVTEYTYVEKIIEKEVIDNVTGEITIVEEKELEKVPTSEVTVYSKDRQTGDIKVCKRGHQCDITGEITLIDPNTGLAIDPPYGFFLSVECDQPNDPLIHSCQAFDTRTQNILTFGDRSFKYTFTTDTRDDPLGFYVASIAVTSKFKITDPTTGLERPEVRESSLRIEVVE